MSAVMAIVVCDDIRREASGKDILIGTYAGNIVVAQYPFKIRLAFWVEYQADRAGEHVIKLRVTYSGKAPGEVTINAQIPESGTVTLPLTGLEVNGDAAGELTIDHLSDEQDWQRVKTITVRKGAVTGLAAPTMAPPSVRMN